MLAVAAILFVVMIVVISVINRVHYNERNKELADKADTDQLTGLNNKIATERKIQEYIEQNPGAELTLSALASKCFYNPSYFSRLFKQKFHMSLTEYVTRKRIENAIWLLCSTTLSVDEISQKTGFVDRSTFYAAFSRITGTTPAQYRSSNRA